MFDKILSSEPIREFIAGNSRGRDDFSPVRVMFKQAAWAFERALANTPVRMAWNGSDEKTRNVDTFVIFDSEDGRVVRIPVTMSKTVIEIGSRIVFVAHQRGALLLAKAMLVEIIRMQNGEVIV